MGLAISLLGIFLAWKTFVFFSALQRYNYLPGMRPPFSSLSIFGAIISTRWWNPGINWSWEWRKTAFFNHKYDIITMIPFVVGTPVYYTNSLDVVKQILTSEQKMLQIKPPELTSILRFWGDNIISANEEMWKRHRRIMAPSFTVNTYSLVVKQVISTYNEMVASENWEGKDEFIVSPFNRIPLRLALIIIARCGFGLHMPWVEDQAETMSFGEALTIVSETSIPRLILPCWAYILPIKSLQKWDHAWVTLGKLMHEFINSRREDLANDREKYIQAGDLFTRLVGAYGGEAKYSLEEQEILGNTFALMFAGHETTASGLNATLGFLAIHQEEQEQAYKEIIQAIPKGQDPTVENITQLHHTLACFHEALRIYPAAFMLTRDMTEDLAVKVTHPSEKTIILKTGTRVIIDMIGVHHNPNTFPQPEKFIPSRWYGVPELDVSVFGAGPRACIGRKFSHTEVLTFLALFLKDWKVDIVLQEGESREEYEERVMGNAGRVGLAFGVHEVTLKLVRR